MDPAVAWFQEEQKGPSQRTWDKIWGTVQQLEQSRDAATADAPPSQNPKTAKEMNMLNDRTTDAAAAAAATAMRQPLAARDVSNNGIGNNATANHNNSNSTTTASNNPAAERTYYNPSRRKAATNQLDTNRASTWNMNRYQQRLVGKHGGCPWRPTGFKYGRGVLG